MEADDRRAGLGEVRHDAVDRLHHQMHVDRHRRVRLDRRADQRADREVRNVMVVHHVEVDEVGAGGDDRAHLLAQPREIGGQERRRNPEGRGIGSIIRVAAMSGSSDRLAAWRRAIRNTRSTVKPVPVPRRPVGPGEEPVRLHLHDHDHQHRRRRRAAGQPALDHHRRRPPGAGGQGPGRGRPAAAAQARRELRVHERRLDPDRRGHDAGQLPDGGRGRKGIRRADPARSRCPCRARCIRRPSCAVARRWRAAALLRFGPIVQPHDGDGDQPARPAPRGRTIPSCPRSLRSSARARRRRRRACLLVAGCATVPRTGATPPPPSRAAAAAARRATAAPSLPAQFTPAAWTALPGWSDDRSRRLARVPRRLPRVARRPEDARRSGSRPAPTRTRRRASDRSAVRAFFEPILVPYRVAAADGRDTGPSPDTTSRCSRQPHARRTFTVPLYAPPDDLLTVDLAGALPGAEGQARARPRRRAGGRALLVARGHRARRGAGRRQGARVRRRSGRGLLPPDPGLGPRRARRRRGDARRLRRPERPPVPLDRPAC